jgi:predicted AAA+ superfamily ATPase
VARPAYIARSADSVLEQLLAVHPAVMVTGPRATGKTTTCERLAASVIRLGAPQTAAAFAADPVSVLDGLAPPVLIDEWQEVPRSLQALKVSVDRSPAPGSFLVTGSARGDIDAPTWPGTGRLIRLEMRGLVEREIESKTASPSWFTRLVEGVEPPRTRSDVDLRGYVRRALRSGFPPAVRLADEADRSRWLASYVDQLVTRDAATVAAGRDPHRLRAYLKALALSSAGTADDTTLWTAAGIAKDTARAYESLLQNLFVSQPLPAWTSNRLKRLTLAPKRYLADPGLFAGILGVREQDVLLDADLLGRVLDTFVVAQIRAEVALMAPAPRLHHLRTAEGRHEIDLLIEVGARRVIGVEIKATDSPDPGDATHLRWLRRELGSAVMATVLFHTGRHTLRFDDGTIAAPIAALWS